MAAVVDEGIGHHDSLANHAGSPAAGSPISVRLRYCTGVGRGAYHSIGPALVCVRLSGWTSLETDVSGSGPLRRRGLLRDTRPDRCSGADLYRAGLPAVRAAYDPRLWSTALGIAVCRNRCQISHPGPGLRSDAVDTGNSDQRIRYSGQPFNPDAFATGFAASKDELATAANSRCLGSLRHDRYDFLFSLCPAHRSRVSSRRKSHAGGVHGETPSRRTFREYGDRAVA